jgi:hypothetical protein
MGYDASQRTCAVCSVSGCEDCRPDYRTCISCAQPASLDSATGNCVILMPPAGPVPPGVDQAILSLQLSFCYQRSLSQLQAELDTVLGVLPNGTVEYAAFIDGTPGAPTGCAGPCAVRALAPITVTARVDAARQVAAWIDGTFGPGTVSLGGSASQVRQTHTWGRG